MSPKVSWTAGGASPDDGLCPPHPHYNTLKTNQVGDFPTVFSGLFRGPWTAHRSPPDVNAQPGRVTNEISVLMLDPSKSIKYNCTKPHRWQPSQETGSFLVPLSAPGKQGSCAHWRSLSGTWHHPGTRQCGTCTHTYQRAPSRAPPSVMTVTLTGPRITEETRR